MPWTPEETTSLADVAAHDLRMLQHAQPGLNFSRPDMLVDRILHAERPAVGCESTDLPGVSTSSYILSIYRHIN